MLFTIALYQKHKYNKNFTSKFLCFAGKCGHLFWSILTGSDIHRDAIIASTIWLPHPNGIIIHRDAIIGDHCIIMQQVTIGQVAAQGAPQLGSGVYVGAGAKILGDIRIGNNVRIGANSVVLKDIPDNATVVGIPGRIKKIVSQNNYQGGHNQ